MLQVAFEREGASPDRAAVLAEAALLALADHAGGRDFYLPRAVLLKNSLRDERIRSDFNGRNLEDVAKAHNLSTRRVRDIIAEGLRRSANR